MREMLLSLSDSFLLVCTVVIVLAIPGIPVWGAICKWRDRNDESTEYWKPDDD